ncbi:MAG: hypothetical protein GY869_26310, partial [Planctomycetes bacterium]|nr:hypothetical protein [Planctomycetota bacterium]
FPMSDSTFFTQIITIFHGSGGILPVFGLCMIIYVYIWRYGQHKSLIKTLTRDEFAPLLISFPIPVFWSAFLDFRGYDDFFVFLPYVMIGFAKMLDLLIVQMGSISINLNQKRLPQVMTVIFCIALVCIAAMTIRYNRNTRLVEQKQALAEIEKRFGTDFKLIIIDEPQPLVFFHKINPTRYVYAFFHFDRWIHDHTPGGIDGWLEELDAYQADVVVYGNNPCTYAEKIREWLARNFESDQIGPWLVYYRDPGGTK